MTVVNRFVQAVSHGGQMTKPTLIVIHSAETPLAGGYAKSIAENWFGKSATTSAHFMVDPVEIIRMLSDNVVSYAVGPKANGFTLNVEQAGRAAFTRAQWTTPDGLEQHRKVGALVRELSDSHGIPLRWATDQQIRDAARGIPGGVCFHDDIHRVLGGTTHTDPVPYYPADLVMANATGGTAVQEDDMPLSVDDLKAIREFVWRDALPDGLIPITLLADVQHALRDTIHSIVPGSDVSLAPRDMLASVDSNAYSTAQQIAGLSAAVNALADKVGAQGGASADELKAAVTQAMEQVVHVQVSVGTDS